MNTVSHSLNATHPQDNSNLAGALHADIFQRLQERIFPGDTAAPAHLTVGVEHEFFLFNAAGETASHPESQHFLSLLGDKIVHEADGDGGEYIAEVHFGWDEATDFATKIKYDHHPHLLEIASAPQPDLHELQSHLQMLFTLAENAAQSCRLVISANANLGKSAAHPSLQSPLPAYQNLRFYRRKLLERHEPEQARESAWVGHFCNYAAVVAATQVHVGGLEWWRNEEIISRLYRSEPELLFFSSLHPGATPDGFDLSQRWIGYKTVFEQYPLAGFPRFDEWTMQSWQRALLNSPLAGGADDAWAALSTESYGRPPGDSWDIFWKNVRDLQIIRPRLFGTLEFRADPAQPSVAAIMGMAALRLGLCCHALTADAETDTFALARDNWWKAVAASEPPSFSATIGETFNNAYQGLKSRQLGEEKYLHAAFPEFARTI
jgi:hypothetical protein